jgi:quercetin dioxygenase-like cupin family protein
VQIRRFGPELKTPIPGNHRDLFAVPIHFDRAAFAAADPQALARRFNGAPILTDRPLTVVALYLDAHAAMDEHSAAQPILLLVTGGAGFVRVGGPRGETRAVAAGDAVLWPSGLDHMVWTEDEALQAILVDGPPERTATGA